MSKDPHSGIDLDYLLDHLPPDALTDWVDRETAAAGKKLRRSKYKYCPFPDHADSKPSFSVTEGKGWHCFGCNGPDGKGRRGTDVVSLVKQLRGYASMDDAIIEVATYYNVTRPQSPRRKRPPEAPRGPRNAQELLDHLLLLPDHSALSAGLHAALLSEEGAEGRAYLEGRGIFEASWIRHELGYVVPGSHPGAPLGPAWEGMITFPIRAGEHVINFAGRRIREGEPDKLNCLNLERWPFNMNALLLEEQEARQTVHVCEGPISALALEEMGCKPAVALLGKKIPKEWWPLFSRRALAGETEEQFDEHAPVVLALDAEKGETEEQFDERQNATVRRMRRLGWRRYMRPFASFLGASYAETFPYYMDPADVWKASGFSPKTAASVLNPIVKLLADADQAHDPGLAYDVILPGPPDKDVAEVFAGAVAKNTPGLTLTLRFEDGPGLGYYLEFTRAGGHAFPLNMNQQPEVPQAKVLGVYARQDPTSVTENVYVQGEREVNLQLMAGIKKLRRGLHLAVADGLDPGLLNELKGRRPALPTTAKMPTHIMKHPATRPKRAIGYRLRLQGPQGKSYEVIAVDRQENPLEQLSLPGLETLSAFDMNIGRGAYALYSRDPAVILRTSGREMARLLGLNPDSGNLMKDITDSLTRLSGWAWRFDGVDQDGTPRGRLLRLIADYEYEGDKLKIGIPPLTHELLTEGRQGRDWMLVSLEKYRGLSPAASTLWSLVSAWRAPREWEEDNLASLVSGNQRARERRDTLYKALDELVERGQLYKWERVQGSTTGAFIIRLLKTVSEARSKLRRKDERTINVRVIRRG